MAQYQQVTVLLSDVFEDRLALVAAQNSTAYLYASPLGPLANRSLEPVEIGDGR